MPRAIGKTMLAERAVIDGTPVASVRSVMCSAYPSPSAVRPIALTNTSAIRRASPESRSALDMSIAASTIQTDGDPYPLRARSTGTPPTTTSVVTPISTT